MKTLYIFCDNLKSEISDFISFILLYLGLLLVIKLLIIHTVIWAK